jgi:hypothetical protein
MSMVVHLAGVVEDPGAPTLNIKKR